MIRKLGRGTALAVVAGALVLGGCGSSSDDDMDGDMDGGSEQPANNDTDPVTITADLDGAQTVPAVPTRATGSLQITVDPTTGAVSGTVTHSVTDVTVAHIHEGAIGETGDAIVNLEISAPGEFTVPTDAVLSADQIAAFQAGNLYVNVHSELYPDGEIRAQLTNDPVTIPVLATLDDIQAKVFTPVCSGCHSGGGANLPAVMDLSTAEGSFAALPGVASIQESGFDRVTAGDAQNSYLVVKIEGRQQVGSRMPLGQAALDDQTISVIRQWIDDGAVR